MTSLGHVTVRKVVQADLEPLVDLAFAYVDFYQVTPPPREQMKQLFAHLLEAPERGVQFVAESDGEFLGFATLYFTFSSLRAKPAAIMNDLFVKQEHRRKNIGEQLFSACKQHVEANGYAFMEWVTAEDNVNAQNFYGKMGATKSNWTVYVM